MCLSAERLQYTVQVKEIPDLAAHSLCDVFLFFFVQNVTVYVCGLISVGCVYVHNVNSFFFLLFFGEKK